MFPILKEKIKTITFFGKILIVNALVRENNTPFIRTFL